MFSDLSVQRHTAIFGTAEISVEHSLHLTEIINGIIFGNSIPEFNGRDHRKINFFVDFFKRLHNFLYSVAQIILRLDTEDELELTADADGRFTHTFDVMDDQVHLIQITATAPGKDPCRDMVIFVTEYETIRDGVKAFQKNLTDHTIAKMAKDPESYVGERVKISVRVKEVTYTDKGLGILCTYNPPSGSKAAKTPLYLTLYGYAQDQISDNMVMTVYGTVEGAQQVGDESRLSILVQYGTYLVSKQK